jgi:hypothetical protein
MNTKIQKTILAGIIGTAAMTALTMIAPMMGMPEMSPPKMLAGMLGMPIIIGWFMHFMIGTIFAFAYTYLGFFKWKISNLYLKGAAFGILIFVVAQIAMAIMKAMMPMPEMEGSMMLSLIGSMAGHIIFGMAVAKTVGNDIKQTSNL